MRRLIIAGNWKMNMTAKEANDFFANLQDTQHEVKQNVSRIICPSFVLLSEMIKTQQKTNFFVGAQNVSEHEKGAFTGEVSAEILHSIGAKYCIIGHSERRQYYGETDEIIQQKWGQLRRFNINPIICIGETLAERENNRTLEVIGTQIQAIFSRQVFLPEEDLLVAYEPVWAIGTGKTATPEIAQTVHSYIRELLTKHYGKIAQSIPLLYGGSVKPSNLKELLNQKDIDGALVGGASLSSHDFLAMVSIAGEIQ